MSLREFGFYISGSINVIILNSSGLVIAMYDCRNTIPDNILDYEVVRITSAQLNTIWIEVRD